MDKYGLILKNEKKKANSFLFNIIYNGHNNMDCDRL